MKSIRLYLVAALLSTITLGIFLAVLQGYRTGTEKAQALLDLQLADAAALIAIQRPAATVMSEPPSGRLAFQVWGKDGELLRRSANAINEPFAGFEEGYSEQNFSGHRWRVLSQFDAGAARWIFVGERIDLRVELADGIVVQSVLPIVISLPVVAAIVWFFVGNGLSLIRNLASELGTKRADDLSLLKTTDPPVELAPVVTAINDLLSRLDASVQRERRFSADAAHELRTPLAALKVHIHNLKAELPEHVDQLRSLDQDLARLSHLVDQILLLYRMTPEHYQAKMQRTDLYELAQSSIADLYDEIEKRHQSISLDGSNEEITGDKSSLGILLKNLILNASKYSPEGAVISIRVDRHDAGVLLEVSDTGPGIPLTDLARVMDRFYRVGGDRHDSETEGCGLGLSIVNHIADLHRANLNLYNRGSDGGLIVSIVFPDNLDSTTMAVWS